jgi:hypothetical protein
MKHRGVKLRQTYVRVSQRLAVQASRYAHAKQFKRMKGALKKLRTILGRVLRDIGRKVPYSHVCLGPDVCLGNLLQRCQRLHAQQPTDKHKLYSLHEPAVQCIRLHCSELSRLNTGLNANSKAARGRIDLKRDLVRGRLVSDTSSVKRFQSPPQTAVAGSWVPNCARVTRTMATPLPAR